jgi:hypothetical protein
MKNLNVRWFCWVAVGLTLATVAVAALAFKMPVQEGKPLLKVASTAVTVDVLAWLLFSKWGWKLRFLQGWLVPFPNLNGTWDGEIESNWVDPETGKRISKIPAVLVINQDFTRISVTMTTGESSSTSFGESFEIDEDSNEKKLVYSYSNQPKAGVGDRSSPHKGTTEFRLLGKNVHTLEGHYWNDRSQPVSGDLVFRFRSRDTDSQGINEMSSHPMANRLRKGQRKRHRKSK